MIRPFRALLAALLVSPILLVVVATPAAAGPVDGSSCAQQVRIVDVSSYQPNIDWGNLSRAGISGIYIKTTEGTWYTNPYAGSQRAGAASIGMPSGGYDFARPSDDPAADAAFFVANGGASGTLPPVLDLEVSDGLTSSAVVAWAQTWRQTVWNLTGRSATIYTGSYSWAYDSALAATFPDLWVAAYPWGYTTPPGSSACGLPQPSTLAWGGWSMWQFTSVGNIWGIPGNVDVSVVTPQWWAQATGATVATPDTGSNRYPAATYTVGSSGDKVKWIQGIVGVTADGVFGAQTAAAVAVWQSKLGLTPDGIWGPGTERATADLFTWLAAVKAHNDLVALGQFVAACKASHINLGSTGPCVTLAKHALNHRHAITPKLGHRAVYGNRMGQAVRSFQARRHLQITGHIGPRTWGALL